MSLDATAVDFSGRFSCAPAAVVLGALLLLPGPMGVSKAIVSMLGNERSEEEEKLGERGEEGVGGGARGLSVAVVMIVGNWRDGTLEGVASVSEELDSSSHESATAAAAAFLLVAFGVAAVPDGDIDRFWRDSLRRAALGCLDMVDEL